MTGTDFHEVIDDLALGVALLMDRGTASVYGPRAWRAFGEFASPPPQRYWPW